MCNPGLGFKAPAEARVGNYIDKKCPFTGKVTFVSDLLVVHIEDAEYDNGRLILFSAV